MSSRASGGRPTYRRRLPAVIAAAALAAFLVVPAPALGYPPLPVGLSRGFLGNLTAPVLVPGASGSVTFTVSDPLPSALDGVVVTFEVYAFNGFPGGSPTLAPVPGAPLLTTPSSSGATANVTVGTLANASVFHGSVGVQTSDSAPNGAFALRTALSFTLASNGTGYRLESRGWFNATTWAAATELPNGSATLNLSRLGVSGVTPETAVEVAASDWPWVLAALLAGSVVLVGAGAYVYFRRGPGSRSGAR